MTRISPAANPTRSSLHHWPRFSVRGSEFPRHGPPVDFHTTEEWVMPNLHFACDFVFDVTRSLLIMQWTRREYARTTAPPPFLARRPPSRAQPSRAHVLFFFLSFSLSPSASSFFLPFFLSFFLYLFTFSQFVRFGWNIAIREAARTQSSDRKGSSRVSFHVCEFSLLFAFSWPREFWIFKVKNISSDCATLRIREEKFERVCWIPLRRIFLFLFLFFSFFPARKVANQWLHKLYVATYFILAGNTRQLTLELHRETVETYRTFLTHRFHGATFVLRSV